MKVFIVVNDYSNMDKHIGEYCNCFLNEVEAYKYALEICNEHVNDKIRVIEKEFKDE